MNKLLIICGPTATGKTSLGISMAKKFNGEIISADSRQVYKGMDIGTGKDLPSNLKFKIKNLKLGGAYEINDVLVWGYDLVGPKKEFSVSQYLMFAQKTISDIWKRGKLPILVGGTGLYIKAVVDGIPTINVPRNEELRKKLEELNVDQLYENLSQLDSLRAGAMNTSDRKNPRRLIRAVEIAQYLIDHKLPNNKLSVNKKYDTLFIGLTSNYEYLDARIKKRVAARVDQGFEDELKKLLSLGVDWSNQSMLSMGYRQWKSLMDKSSLDQKSVIDKETAISEWEKEERKYARRQMVWWNKDKRINWFDISLPEYPKKVENMIEKWHNSSNV
jgi:tRNA dimethylallyltransferase